MHRPFFRPAGLVLMTALVVVLVAARAQKPQPPTQAQIDRERAIEVARVINAAEYDYRTNHDGFGSWNEVYASGAVVNLLQTWPRIRDLSIAPGEEVIPGYRLTLLVASEGTEHSVSLHDMKSHGCGLSVFSDQSGLIYEGTIIDCPQIVDHPAVER
ncbi:MAG TPA: hypothetical protein VLY23_01230 [Candidatus Acidoferrum sp.]|nr:hypothetical protein [Candidatus Acidoferrum sp.]